jgi:uncharacterized protein
MMRRWIGALITVFTVLGCSENGPVGNSFDRRRMLTEISDSVIIPAYNNVVDKAVDLQTLIDRFTAAPSISTLAPCKSAWELVALQWQRALPFDFGPAEGSMGNLSVNVATFPVTTNKIEAAIAAADTSLQNFDRDGRGLYGVEYLLFAEDEATTVQRFLDDGVRSAYLRSVVRRMVAELRSVRAAWVGGYRDQFISRSGTDAGSGTSLLFNHLNISFELAKNYKLGLPLGKIAGQTTAEPSKVEAFYSGRSIMLLREHTTSVFNLWYGRTPSGTSILGFRDYLLTVPNGQRSIDETEVQLLAVKGAFDSLHDDEVMSDLISTDPSRLHALHGEMQKLTRFIKSELSSLLGISITYSSGDGD